jgi:hypothetical protein
MFGGGKFFTFGTNYSNNIGSNSKLIFVLRIFVLQTFIVQLIKLVN